MTLRAYELCMAVEVGYLSDLTARLMLGMNRDEWFVTRMAAWYMRRWAGAK